MEKLNATKHYLHYPDGNFPPYLAYGFRPTFLLLAPYMIVNILLWASFWAGILPLSFFNDPITWHVYELLYGVGSAGIIAFLLTGLPELFPGVVPLVGKKLAILIGTWFLGRVSFWLVDFINIYIVAIINLAPLVFMAYYAFKPTVLDASQKHSSIAYTLVIIIAIQVYFFLSVAGLVSQSPMSILYLGIGAFMALILLALRRVNIEAINEWLEDRGIDDVLMVRPPRYNLAVFCIAIYTICEFFFPQNSVLGWLALASGAAILGTLSEYKMEDSFILFEPYVLFLGTVILMMALGYGFMGFTFFFDSLGSVNDFRHFLTIGAFTIAIYMVLVIVSFIHTGRHLKSNWYVKGGFLSLVLATFLRISVSFYPEFATTFYIASSLLWIVAFSLYFAYFYRFLLSPRADGIKG